MITWTDDREVFDKKTNPHLMTKEKKPLSILETESSLTRLDK